MLYKNNSFAYILVRCGEIYMRITKSKLYYIAVILLCLIICSGLLIYPSECAKGGYNGIIYCGSILIPSLFPFMFLSTFIVKSGISEKIGIRIDKATRLLFKANGSVGTVILLSMIGGYPVGAKGIDELVKSNNISKKTAERLVLFSFGSGLAFMIGVIGSTFFHDKIIGLLLFLAQSISTIFIAVLSGFFAKNEVITNIKIPAQRKNFYNAVVESCNDSINAILSMSGFVILFACLIELLNVCGFADFFAKILNCIGFKDSLSHSVLYALLEVTNACNNAVQNGCSIIFIAFAVSFGGVCVHFQVMAMMKNYSVSYGRFVLFRLIHSILCCTVTYIFLKVYNPSKDVFSTYKNNPIITQSKDIAMTISLILLCVIFVFSCFGKKLDRGN